MSITETKEEKFIKALEKLGVSLVLLFGSRADGSFRKESDFDIAYNANKDLSFEEDRELYNILSNYLNSDHIDILDMRKIKPLIFYEIFNNCKVIYAKNMTDFYNRRNYAIKRYYDEVKPLFKMKFERLKSNYLK